MVRFPVLCLNANCEVGNGLGCGRRPYSFVWSLKTHGQEPAGFPFICLAKKPHQAEKEATWSQEVRNMELSNPSAATTTLHPVVGHC